MQNFLIEDGRSAFGPPRQTRSRTSRVLVTALVCAVAGYLLLEAQDVSLSAFMVPVKHPTSYHGESSVPSTVSTADSCRTSTGPKMFIF
jgi:hypothetical protein